MLEVKHGGHDGFLRRTNRAPDRQRRLEPPEEDENIRRWQRRLDPLEQRLFDGCHLTRPIVAMLTRAGFTITDLDVFYEEGAPKPIGADSLGVALPT
jgi:hypothetical protein